MKVLGHRQAAVSEHALCWKLARSPEASAVYLCPGQPGDGAPKPRACRSLRTTWRVSLAFAEKRGDRSHRRRARAAA